MIIFGTDVNTRPLIIAEIGVNHNGDVELAKEMIDAAKESGADVVKFQTFSPERLFVESFAKSRRIKFGDEEMTLWEFLKKVSLSWEDTEKLKEYAEKKGISFLSTPFSFEDADFLESIGVEAFKIASTDLSNYPFLEHIAKKGRPVILSSGTSTLAEIEKAINILKNHNVNVVLLHCVSLYPADPEKIHLRSIQTLRKIFKVPVGFSDHTVGIHIPIAAITLGAQVIEKHFTIDRSLPGPDQACSMTPDELKLLRKAADEVWKALGKEWKEMSEEEMEVARTARRSIVSKDEIKKDEVITIEKVTFKRPGTGIEPEHISHIIGKTAKIDIKKDEIIRWEFLE